jgi:hypothetical protein
MKEVPDDYKPSQELECSGYGYPILDGAVALSIITGVTILFVKAFGPQKSCPPGIPCAASSTGFLQGIAPAAAIYSLFPISLYGISSIVGFGDANDCRKAKKARLEWLQMNPEQQKEFEVQWRKGNQK